MKSTMNTLLRALLICIFFSLFSCEKDLYEQSIKNNSRNITVKDVSLKNLDKSISSKINNEISKLKNLKSETTSQGRFTYDSALNIYIDREKGKLVILDGKEFYTFPMFRVTEEKLQNILFAKKDNGDFDTYFITYDTTPVEFKDLTQEQIDNLSSEYQKIYWNNDSSSAEFICFTFTQTITTYPGCTYADGLHPNGAQCEAEVHVSSATFCTFAESAGGDSNTSTDAGNATDSNTNGTNGSNNSGSNGFVATVTVSLSPEELAVKEFIRDLTDEQEEWFNEQDSDVQENLSNYLVENGFSEESVTFTLGMIDLCIENNSTYMPSNSITIQNSLTFDSINQFQNHLDNLHNADTDNSITDDNGENTKTSRFSFDIGFFCNLNVQVKQKVKTDVQSYSIENVSSSISGNTLATEWHQNDDDDLNISGNVATVTFTGTISMNCFIDGIGIFFSDNVTIVCHFNITTGVLISAQLVGLD